MSPHLSSALRSFEIRALGKLIDDMLVSLISVDSASEDVCLAKLYEIRQLVLGEQSRPSLSTLSDISFEHLHQIMKETIEQAVRV